MIDWNKCAAAFDNAAARKLCKSRGYSKDVVAWLREQKLVGIYEHHIAFPTEGGAHVKARNNWFFTAGAKASPLLLGPIEEGAHVHCFESQWDAIAFADVSGFRENIVAARGAGNARLILEALASAFGSIESAINFSGTLYLWPQTDAPGLKWANDVRRLFPGQMKICSVPAKHKDLCEWIQAGAESSEVMFAMTIGAKDLLPQNTLDGGIDKPIDDSATGLPEGMRSVAGASGDQPSVHSISSLAQALDAIVAFLKKYMRFESDWEADLVALWCCHTWVFSAFSYTPYLHIMSPEKRCGKSRLMDLLDSLVANPWMALRPSEAVMYRKIQRDKPTLLLDEVDTIFGEGEANEPIRAMLNGGYSNGIKVPRCIGKTGDFEEFTVFCPKAIAGIGTLPDTVGDRCIHIPLARQPSEDRAERFRKLDAAIEVQGIRLFLATWGKESLGAMSRARPQLPDLDGRHMDIAEPLLAVAEAASEEWAGRGREAIIIAFDQVEDLSGNAVLLKLIKSYWDNHAGDTVTTLDLLNWIVKQADADAPWVSFWERQLANNQINGPSQKLAKMLKDFKRTDGTRIKSRVLNMGEDKQARGFRRDDFDLAFRRYLPNETKAVPMELGFAA